jgi:nicotinate-nucleotide adenylyltransferase
MDPLLLFGGTYDPVHRGHIAAACEVARAFRAPVHLMPAALPPHRDAPGVAAAERLRLLELAAAGYPELRVDARELGRDEPSWTVETLREVRREVGDTRPVILLVGADAFAKFDSWREWRAILDLAHVLVLTRPDAGSAWSDALQAAVEPRGVDRIDALLATPAGHVLKFAVTPVPVSSTEVRRRLQAGAPIDDAVPAAVARHIEAHRLYRRPL